MGTRYSLKAKLWLYDGAAAWHFITLPKGPAKELRAMYAHHRRGWGSLPVTVTIGGTTWRTSIFPDKGKDSYVLPVKAEVRKAERLAVGRQVAFQLHVHPDGNDGLQAD